ncbi:hypothetical protein ACX818_001325 [Acinetobacter baumannii]
MANLKLLKPTKYYWIGEDRVQFKAEVKTVSFFKVPVAKFIWPDKSIVEVSVETFTNKLIFSGDLDFEIVYENGTWLADLREAV